MRILIVDRVLVQAAETLSEHRPLLHFESLRVGAADHAEGESHGNVTETAKVTVS
jgi:hypothetical protein